MFLTTKSCLLLIEICLFHCMHGRVFCLLSKSCLFRKSILWSGETDIAVFYKDKPSFVFSVVCYSVAGSCDFKSYGENNVAYLSFFKDSSAENEQWPLNLNFKKFLPKLHHGDKTCGKYGSLCVFLYNASFLM